MNKLLLAVLLFLLGQTIIWFQTNGQFLWKWFAANPIWLALFGAPVSYLLIMSTKYMVQGFGGLLWPGRFIGFGTGMISFVILTWIFMGEGISTKTAISLVLATTLVSIQILWK